VRLKGERPRWDARRIHAFLERRLDAALLLNSRSASRKVLPFHGAQHHVLAPAHAHHPVLPSMIARRVARNCSSTSRDSGARRFASIDCRATVTPNSSRRLLAIAVGESNPHPGPDVTVCIKMSRLERF
jgi:hypothetical protein